MNNNAYNLKIENIEVSDIIDNDIPIKIENVISPEIAEENKLIETALIPSLLQALLFANGEPLSLERIVEVTTLAKDVIRENITILKEKLRCNDYGFELIEVAGKYQLRTKLEFGAYIRLLKQEKPKKLTQTALETLAIIAYRQPVVRSDIEKIRGVDTTPALKTLLERNLIKIVGHQSSPGNPGLYGTTEEFLKLFGLKGLPELPTLREIDAFVKDPGENEERESEAQA